MVRLASNILICCKYCLEHTFDGDGDDDCGDERGGGGGAISSHDLELGGESAN